MDTENAFIIAYSGSLDGFDPQKTTRKKNPFWSFFWTFRNNAVDSSTRSGYYFILAVALLKKKYGIRSDQLKVKWWGLIDPLNLKQIQELELTGFFEIDGYLNKEISIAKLAAATMLFLPLEKSRSAAHRTLFIPGKLFEYLKTGKPILALCEDSDCKKILSESGLGIFAKPDDPENIAEVLIECIKNKSSLSAMQPRQEKIQQHSFVEKTRALSEIIHRLNTTKSWPAK